MELSLLEIYNLMGNFAKGIVYTLAIMSIWTLSIAIKKWWVCGGAAGTRSSPRVLTVPRGRQPWLTALSPTSHKIPVARSSRRAN